MTTRTAIIWLLLTGLLGLGACHEDSDRIVDDEIIQDPPGTIVSTGLVAVLETPGLTGPQTVQAFDGQTAPFGDWAFRYDRGTQVDREYTLVTLRTADNLEFAQVTALRENDINYVHWSLPEMTTQAGQSDRREDFPVDGVRIRVEAGVLRTSSGASYTGPYTMSFATLDSDSPAMPSFSGMSENEGPVSLMIDKAYYIILRTPDGEVLHAAEGVWIDAPGVAAAGQWYFDPARARWVEHSTGTPGARIDIGASGYYAYADTRPLVRLHGNLAVNGTAIGHHPLDIAYAGIRRRIYTTGAGAWQVQLPAETAIAISVSMPCGEAVTVETMTTSEHDIALPLMLTNANVIALTLTGTMRDCAAQPLPGAFLMPDGDARKVIYPSSASIGSGTLACAGGNISIQAVDPANGQAGADVTWAASDTVDMGTVFACSAAAGEYLLLAVSGEMKMYLNLRSAITPESRLLIEDNDPIDPAAFQVFISGMEARDFADGELNIVFEDMYLGQKGYSLYCPTSTGGCGFTSFTITHYPDMPGEWIRGRFEGRFWTKSFTPLTAGYRPVTGEFQVYRDF